jgi:DNA-binding transcriptional regulator YbjK
MEESKSNGNRRGQRSQEILDAAAKVMATRGYAGTSMSALVQESGIPKSAIYHHFESKAGLLSGDGAWREGVLRCDARCSSAPGRWNAT